MRPVDDAARDSYRDVVRGLRGEVLWQEDLKRRTTFGIGGPADVWVEPADEEGLAAVAGRSRAAGCPCLVLGSGSNVLVPDEGFRGVVLHPGGALSGAAFEGRLARAGAGLLLGALLRRAQEAGLAGLEWSAGIPGSVGGAVATNAGARGESFGDCVRAVRAVAADGNFITLRREELGFGYRRSALPRDAVVVEVELELEPGEPARIAALSEEFMEKRRASQPTGMRSAGSVFKNPPGDAAGRLIDAAGVAGRTCGGASVWAKHANFIVNNGGASARDVVALMELVEREVQERFGVRLEREIRVIGR